MRKQLRIRIVALFILAAIIVWNVIRDREPEPTYQGKGLRVWLRECTDTYKKNVEERVRARTRAVFAIRQIGTNAIPTLLRMLREKDSQTVSSLIEFWNRHLNSLPEWIRYPGWYRNQARFLNEQAARGFEILGPDAQQAVPALVELYDQNESVSLYSQTSIGRALNAMGPEAQGIAIPAFLRAASNSNATVRAAAMIALYQVGPRHQEVVPAMVNALNDTNLMVRWWTTGFLGRFGADAQQAVPALVRLLNDPELRVRQYATNALTRIDREAAFEAGVR